MRAGQAPQAGCGQPVHRNQRYCVGLGNNTRGAVARAAAHADLRRLKDKPGLAGMLQRE
jgi:hypothetical protein